MQSPVSFEIDIKAPGAAAPDVAKRLETTQQNRLTREALESAHAKAESRRAAQLEKRKTAATDRAQKVQLTRERRTSEERATEEKAAADLSSKLQVADEKRTVQISSIQDKARTHNKRVSKRKEELDQKCLQEAESLKAKIDEKIQKSQERYEAQLETVKQTAQASQQPKNLSPQKEQSAKA